MADEDTEEKSGLDKAGSAVEILGKSGEAALTLIGAITKAIKDGKGGLKYDGVNIAAKPKDLDFSKLAGWKTYKSKMYRFDNSKKIGNKVWGVSVPWWYQFDHGGFVKGYPDCLYVRDFRVEIDKANVVCTYGWFCDFKTVLKEPPQNAGTHEKVIADAALGIEVSWGRKVGKKESYSKTIHALGTGKPRIG